MVTLLVLRAQLSFWSLSIPTALCTQLRSSLVVSRTCAHPGREQASSSQFQSGQRPGHPCEMMVLLLATMWPQLVVIMEKAALQPTSHIPP